MAIRLLSIALLALLANPASASPFTTPEPEDQYRVTIYIPIEEIHTIPIDKLIKIPPVGCILVNEGGEPTMVCFVCAEVGGNGGAPIVPRLDVPERKVSIAIALLYQPGSAGWGPYVVTGVGPSGNSDCPVP